VTGKTGTVPGSARRQEIATGRESRGHRAERLRATGHYLTAAVLALKGLAKLDHPEGHGLVIGVCLASAAVIVVVTSFHRRLHEHAAKIEALVYLLEAAVAAVMCATAVAEGKRGLPWAWGVAALGFVIGAVIRFRRGPGSPEESR
jgi:hypothetical protein